MDITREGLPRLLAWAPWLWCKITEPAHDRTGVIFRYLEPRGHRMTIVGWTSLAAEWPSWDRERAAARGLLCAECGLDLRTRDSGVRLPVNVAGEDGRRLICFGCFTAVSDPDPAA